MHSIQYVRIHSIVVNGLRLVQINPAICTIKMSMALFLLHTRSPRQAPGHGNGDIRRYRDSQIALDVLVYPKVDSQEKRLACCVD